MGKKILITIDVDYFPGTYVGVNKLLELLENRDIKATFFITGKFAEEHPETLKRIERDGHDIGCHGYSHGIDSDECLIKLDSNQQLELIKRSTEAIESVIEGDLILFRAPFGKANCGTIAALEALEYVCDSSIASFRFDFGMGVMNEARGFFAPRHPYHPSSEDIYQQGDSKILEVPMSSFILPLTLSAIRVFGLGAVKKVLKFAVKAFDPVVFYLHPWEIMGVNEISLWEGAPKRHFKGRGEKALQDLSLFIDHAGKNMECSTLTNVMKDYEEQA